MNVLDYIATALGVFISYWIGYWVGCEITKDAQPILLEDNISSPGNRNPYSSTNAGDPE